MNLGDHLNLGNKNEKAADVISSFIKSTESQKNQVPEGKDSQENFQDAPQVLQNLNDAFARFQKKYEGYYQQPTFGQWREFVEQEQLIPKEARKELSDFLLEKPGIKTTKEGLASFNSILGYVAREHGVILDNDQARISYNRRIREEQDANPTVSKRYQAYKGRLPSDSKQWSQATPSWEEQQEQYDANLIISESLEKKSAKATDKRLEEKVTEDPVVNKLMDTILPLPEIPSNHEGSGSVRKQISKPKVVYDPRKKFAELDALKHNTAYQEKQRALRTKIQNELLRTTQDKVEQQGGIGQEDTPKSALEERQKFIAEQVQGMTTEEQREMTKTLSQQFLDESLVNEKHRDIDLSVFEKPGLFSKKFITEVLLEDAREHMSASPRAVTDNAAPEKEASEEPIAPAPDEPRIFRKPDGSEVRENPGVETEGGFVNVSPLDSQNRYAIGEEKLERVLRTFQDSEGNILQETDQSGVAEGYVNVRGAGGRQYARQLEGLTRIDHVEAGTVGSSESSQNTTEATTSTEQQQEQQDETITPEDAGTYISRHDSEDAQIEDAQPNTIETTNIDLVRQAYEAGTGPVLNYKGHEMQVVGMSEGTMVVAYGNQRRTIDAGEELAKDMRTGKISFTITAETQPSTPESRQEKAEKDFKEKYKADVKDQPLWKRFAERVWYGRGAGDLLEQKVMSEETKASYEKYQNTMKEKAQSTYDAFLSKMDGKDGWDDARKQEVAKRLRDRYYGIQYIRGRQSLLRELRHDSLMEKGGIYAASEKALDGTWRKFEKEKPRVAALLKVGGMSALFASSVVAFGGLRVLGGALAGFTTRQLLNSKYARINNFNLHTEELIRAQHKGKIDDLTSKQAQQNNEYDTRLENLQNHINTLKAQGKTDIEINEDKKFKELNKGIAKTVNQNADTFYRKESETKQFMERSRIEQLRKDFEAGKIDGVALQQKLESIDRGDVRRFRANWFFTALAAGASGRAAGQSEFLHTALSDLGVPRDWMDGYFFAVKGENPQPISQDNLISPEPTAQRAAEVIIPEVTPDQSTLPEGIPSAEAVNDTYTQPTEGVPTPGPDSAKEAATPPKEAAPTPKTETPSQTASTQAPAPDFVAPVTETTTVQTPPETPASGEWKKYQIDVETKGPKIEGSGGDGTYTQNLPGATDFSNDPTYGYIPPQQGGPINTSGPIVNPDAKMGPGGRIVLDPGGNREYRVDIGNGKNIPTRNDNPTGPADVITGIFKGR